MVGVLLIEIFFILILAGFFVFFVTQFFNVMFRGFAPFIATNKQAITEILKPIDIRPDAKVIELGAGRAGFLRAFRKKFPQAELIGVEYSFVPYLIGRIQNSFSHSRLQLRKENIFKTSFAGADLIYCYLNPATMEKLEPKFKTELKPGARIISFQFPLPNIEAKETLELGSKKRVFYYTI